MATLHDLYSKIPPKWKLWILSFLFGLVVTLIWDIGALLVILFLIGVIAAMFVSLGFAKTSRVERWALDQFWARIRGMLVFAILPAAWEIIKNLINSPSTSSVFELLVILLIVAVIWDRFEIIRKSWRGIGMKPRRRRYPRKKRLG